MKIEEKAIEILKQQVCDSCLGRQFGSLLSGFSNDQRGKIIRQYVAFLIDSGEKVDADLSNFYGIKFRNVKIKPEKPGKCKLCRNFFFEEINEKAKEIIKKFKEIEFKTFLIGSIVSDEMLKSEEEIWSRVGIEYCEPIKSEINRELGKRIEKLAGKKFESKNPDVTVIVDLNENKIKIEIRSLYVSGKYQKLVRGIPQSKWVCLRCSGKGCTFCKGEGKLYPTSVQEIIDKPLLKATGGKKSKFSAHGREDIDARCLDYRPFVLELIKPTKRKIDLKKVEREINKSKKVKVKNLKIATREAIKKLKFMKFDKTYLATVKFEKKIDRKKLKQLGSLTKEPILQKTPLRVVHRRADKLRRRKVKKISWKVSGEKELRLKIKGETGLYIKELITGDEGRTKPNISEILNNKVKRISLDVIKIHSKG
jgi:tRNA pseudouridine synthase 10